VNLDQFVQQRETSWRNLESLLHRAKNNLSRLSEQEIGLLGRYYRMTTSDLALAQRDFPNQTVVVYLNQLVGQAHALIYQNDPLSWQRLGDFFRRKFPQLYRVLLPYTTLAFVLFLLPAVACFSIVWNMPDTIYVFEGEEIGYVVREVEEGKLWTEIAPTVRSAASALILTNNIQVMFLTFAGGITAGLLSAWVMLSNGIHLGALFGLLHVHGLSGGLAGFVVAHGFIELSVIFLAGGCGLYLGDGLLRPGLLSRRAALVQRGRLSVQLILGCIPLLILAGVIEGFISPSGLPWLVKLATGLATGIALHAYWLRAGREPEER
jgi:uncharacterized membrane protein SpoIIM required for sporulation